MTDRNGLAAYLETSSSGFTESQLDGITVAGRLLAAAQEVTRSVEEALRRVGVPHGELEVLIALRMHRDHLPLTPGDVASMLGVSTGAMTKRLDGLEDRGLITRLPHHHDRRSVSLHLTEEGSDMADRALVIKAEAIASAIPDALSDRQLNQLAGLLEKIADRISNR